MANQGDGSYSRSHSAPRKIRLNHDETWGKWKASEADRRGIPVKRSLAERLGKKVEVDKAPKREKAANCTGDIRVKTLEEIRQEKADQQGRTPAHLRAAGQCKTEGRSSEAGPSLAVYRAENKTQSTLPLSVSAKVKLEEPAEKVKAFEEIHIKTLEEIKREKALRLQQREESVSAPPAPPAPAPAWRKLIQTPKLIAAGKEEKKNVELSASVPEAACAPARKHKAAEMCRCAVSPTSADATEEPAAKTVAVAVVAAPSEDTLVTIPEAEKPPKSPDLHLGCWAGSVAQSEDLSSASASLQTAAKTQELCCTGAGTAPFSAEDDLEKLMLDISGGELEGAMDLEPGKDVDELLQELSDLIDSITE